MDALTNSDLLDSLSSGLEAATGRDPDRTYTVVDGSIVDDQGEVVGPADEPRPFAVDSRDAAEWLMERYSEIDGERAGIAARRAALLDGLARQEAACERRRKYLDWKYGAQLEAFARSELAGKRERTLRLGWGAVEFRRKPGTVRVADQIEAAEWMKARGFGSRVKVRTVESVTAKAVLDARAAIAEATGREPERLGWLEETGPGETVRVVTGVAIEVER